MRRLSFQLMFAALSMSIFALSNQAIYAQQGAPALVPAYDGFEGEIKWRLDEELVNNNFCYGSGIGDISRSTEVAYKGNSSFLVWANKNRSQYSNHVIAGLPVLNRGVSGKWTYRVYAFIAPPAPGRIGEVGPEISLQNTRTVMPGVRRTFIGGIQYYANPQDPAKFGKWGVWAGTGPEAAEWMIFTHQPISTGKWYRITLEVDYDQNKYVRFELKGEGVDLSIDLSRYAIAGLNKGFDEAFVLTLEGENQYREKCQQEPPTDYKVFYDEVELEHQLFAEGEWSIIGAADTAPNPSDINVSVGGTAIGRFSELKLFHKSGDAGFPQVFSVKGSGAVRPALPGGDFGATPYPLPVIWDCDQTKGAGGFLETKITELDIRRSPSDPQKLQLRGKGSNFSSVDAVEFTMLFQPPTSDSLKVDVSYLLVATRAFCIDQSRQRLHEGFRVGHTSSSYLSEQTRDSDALFFVGSSGKVIRTDLRNQNGFILADPLLPLGLPWLSLLHSSNSPRNTPTVRTRFISPDYSEITPQGYVTYTTDPNDDNVDLWGNWDKAKAQYASGETIGQFTLTINAASPGLRKSASVSGASFIGESIAPDSIVSAFGTFLATVIRGASGIPLPTSLGGTVVIVKDGEGVDRFAPLFYVSPTQVNYAVPTETRTGSGTVTIISDDGDISSEEIQLTRLSPGVFAANANGRGVAAARALRVRQDNSRIDEAVMQLDQQNRFIPKPIDLGPETDQVFLLLFGTGIRYRSDQSTVKVTIGGVPVDVQYADRQGEYVGLDQINLALPRSLQGKGEVDVQLTVEGKPANPVRIHIK